MVSARTTSDFRRPRGRPLPGPEETLRQTVDELAVVRRQVVEKTVDGFDDDAPLRETGDGTEGVQPRLHLDGHSDAELWVVFDLLPFARAGGRASGAAPIALSILRHGAVRSAARLRCADFAAHRTRASNNETPAKTSPSAMVQGKRHARRARATSPRAKRRKVFAAGGLS